METQFPTPALVLPCGCLMVCKMRLPSLLLKNRDAMVSAHRTPVKVSVQTQMPRLRAVGPPPPSAHAGARALHLRELTPSRPSLSSLPLKPTAAPPQA